MENTNHHAFMPGMTAKNTIDPDDSKQFFWNGGAGEKKGKTKKNEVSPALFVRDWKKRELPVMCNNIWMQMQTLWEDDA